MPRAFGREEAERDRAGRSSDPAAGTRSSHPTRFDPAANRRYATADSASIYFSTTAMQLRDGGTAPIALLR